MTSTLIFYNSIILFSTFFIYLSEKGKYPIDHKALCLIALFIIIAPSALRNNIGTDFQNYTNIYLNIENHPKIEWLFRTLIKGLKNLQLPPQSLIVTTSFLFGLIALKSYPKEGGYYVHLALMLSLYLFSFTGIRQSLAIVCTLLAFRYYINKKTIVFVVLIIIGSLFHKANAVFIVIWLISKITIPKIWKKHIIPYILIATVFALNSFIPQILIFIELILNYFNISYAIYFNNNFFFRETEVGTGLGVLAKLLTASYLIYLTQFLLQKNTNYWFFTICVFFYAAAIILSKEIAIFNRLERTFGFVPIVGTYLLFTDISKYRQISRIIGILFLLFLIYNFQQAVIQKPTDYYDPKLVPYTTIFNKGT